MSKTPISSVPATARDYLANERTFLAYVRTALAFIGFGFVVARFSLFARELKLISPTLPAGTHISIALGIAMAIIGVAFAIFGTVRYVEQDRALRRDRIAGLSERSAIVMTLVVAVFGSIIVLDLISIH